MSAIEQLPQTLRNISQVALAKMRLGDSLQMRDERSKLENWLGGGVSELDGLPGDRILAALQAFHESQVFRGLSQARLVCYGCTQPFGAQPHPFRLIEDAQRFGKLLDYVDRYRHRTRIFRKCYRGLLNCYFSYDPYSENVSSEGRKNWEALRAFLYARKDNLNTKGFNPGWVAALSDHVNLLAEDPCGCYGLAALEGNWTAADEIRNRLEVADDSWLIRRLIVTQVKAVLVLDDQPFKEFIDNVLLLLSQHRFYADTGLQRLLDRYVKCAEQEINAPLRDFAVATWGNPWLDGNAHLWQCRPEAKDMVTAWLKRHLIHEFFSTLSSDDGDNPRRLNFWELYCDDLQGMYFALGKDAFIRGNKDFYKFRKSARDLVVKLSDGESDFHALIMQFEQHHVVEFSRHNKVAYFYDTKKGMPPFYFSKGWVEIGALSVGSVLKGSSMAPLSKPFRHQDMKNLTWEGRFAEEMGASDNAIKAFCRKYQCRYKDLRHRGDYQWILSSVDLTQYAQEVRSVLQGWGFAWSSDRKGFYRMKD